MSLPNLICWATCEVIWTINIFIYRYIYSYIFFKSKGKSHTGADYCSLHSISYNIHLNFITLFSYIDSNFSVKYTFFFNYLTPDSFHHAQNSRSSLSVSLFISRLCIMLSAPSQIATTPLCINRRPHRLPPTPLRLSSRTSYPGASPGSLSFPRRSG